MGIEFATKNIYKLADPADSARLIVCCEVLEHHEKPRDALGALALIAQPYCLLSVPREPLWRTLNMVRGKYWRGFGNTPGHLQHWSAAAFLSGVGLVWKI